MLMKKMPLWASCLFLFSIGLTGCNSGSDCDIEIQNKMEEVTKRESDLPFYGIDISEYWGWYDTPDMKPEIIKTILEQGNAAINVYITNTKDKVTLSPDVLGMHPFVDSGWRLILDNSSHDKFILTHINALDSHYTGGITFPYGYAYPYNCTLHFNSDSYYIDVPNSFQDITNYMYIYIGYNFDSWSSNFYSCWESRAIPIKGPVIVIGKNKLPEVDYMYPKFN